MKEDGGNMNPTRSKHNKKREYKIRQLDKNKINITTKLIKCYIIHTISLRIEQTANYGHK